MEIQENKIYINFYNAQRGLSPMWTSLKGFEIAGEDKVFYPAFAEIETTTARLAVSSAKSLIPLPCGMRKELCGSKYFQYSWHPRGTLPDG